MTRESVSDLKSQIDAAAEAPRDRTVVARRPGSAGRKAGLCRADSRESAGARRDRAPARRRRRIDRHRDRPVGRRERAVAVQIPDADDPPPGRRRRGGRGTSPPHERLAVRGEARAMTRSSSIRRDPSAICAVTAKAAAVVRLAYDGFAGGRRRIARRSGRIQPGRARWRRAARAHARATGVRPPIRTWASAPTPAPAPAPAPARRPRPPAGAAPELHFHLRAEAAGACYSAAAPAAESDHRGPDRFDRTDHRRAVAA